MEVKITFKYQVLFVNQLFGFTVHGASENVKRMKYQTSDNPIPHPDAESLKKSQMFRELREKLIFYDLKGSTRDETPQRASDENGVKKSSTERPARNKRSLGNSNAASTETNLKLRTHSTFKVVDVGLKGNKNISSGENNKAESEKERLVSNKIIKLSKDNRKAEMEKNGGAPRLPNESIERYTDIRKQPEVKIFRRLEPHLPKLKNGDKYSQPADKERFRRGQTSRNPIPHPPPESTSWDPKENKRTFALTDDTSKVLQRKTLLYSDPFYRPTGVVSSREEPIDPRRLISILGDPVPLRKNTIPRKLDVSDENKKVGSSGYLLRKGREKGSRYKRGHSRHHREVKGMKFKNWDQDERIRHKVSYH